MPLSLLRGPWCIVEDRLPGLLAIGERCLVDITAVNELPKSTANARAPARDTAVIPIVGPIARYESWLTELTGWPSVEGITARLRAANADPSISRVVLDIDSVGGVVGGMYDLAEMIRNSRKPVVAWVDGMAASAAYWLASAAGTVVTSSTGMVGSIGCVMTWRPDPSQPTRIISSQSPLKNLAPDTKTGRAEYQRVVNDLAAVFISHVATFRGVTSMNVETNFGRGGLLVGAHAVTAGMADRTGVFNDAMSAAPTLRGTAARPHVTAAPAKSAAQQMDEQVQALVHAGLDHSLAVLQVARDSAANAAARNAAPTAPPREDPNILAHYEAALARLVAAGTPAAVAPLTLARTEPALAAAGARAAREAADKAKEIIRGY
ncbi:MAG: S49 family peptidase [Sphingobacteriia bacterium]|nr:S49 family peptidase [Sphingobacteriia bacterium]